MDSSLSLGQLEIYFIILLPKTDINGLEKKKRVPFLPQKQGNAFWTNTA